MNEKHPVFKNSKELQQRFSHFGIFALEHIPKSRILMEHTGFVR